LRARRWISLFIVIIYFISVSHVDAIPMFYGGSFGRQGMWTRLLDTNATIFWSQGDFWHYPWEAEDLHQLADHGVKINYRIYWWEKFQNGEIAWNTSVVDFYYNTSLMKLLEQEIDAQLLHLDLNKIWAVTLSEEEPMHAYYPFWRIEAFKKYNDTYHSETGFWLRWRDSSAFYENKTEEIVLNNWLSEKFVGVFNHLYDYIKGKWPHLLVFQFTGLWPGAPPVYVSGIDVNDLKADAYMGDLYFYEVYDNPFWLYEFVRNVKSTFPDKEYHLHLWGVEPFPTEQKEEGGFEHMRRNAWVAYLAGVDSIGWFVWHHLYGQVWERDDTFARRLYIYINRLNREFSKLPPMKPRPQVLIIRDQMMSFQVGLSADLGLFNEWDTVNQRTFAKKEMNLSQYKLIIVNEDRYYNEVVEKLNEYVKSGGNLILLGGFGWDQRNFYDNATRTSKFLIEEGVTQKHIGGNIKLDITIPNPLGLNLQCNVKTSVLAIAKNTLTKNHHPIGEFYLIDEDGRLTPLEDCPLVLYHNSSNPHEGSILYWGIPSTYPILGEPDIEDVVEAFLPEWKYIRFLYRNVTRAFARNYLHLNASIATIQTENMIITQSKIDEGVILAGIANFYPQTIDVNYTLDLDSFNLPEGEYWVHSLDEDLTLEWFKSRQSLLEVPLSIVANGIKLLLISQQQLEPSYSVNVFPDIPTPEEVEYLTPPRFRTIDAFETKQLIESNPNILILDVRPANEFDQGHIEGAINIPRQELQQRLGELNESMDIVVYSDRGLESTLASQLLVNNGFTKIYNMQGGITSWVQDAKYPVVSTSTISITLSATTIHMGETITVSGSISPQVPGVPVVLTYSKGDTKVERTVTSTEDGSFNDTYTPDAAGAWSISASWKGNKEFEGATSETMSFEVVEKTEKVAENADTTIAIYTMMGGLLIIAVSVVIIFIAIRRKKTSNSR